MSIYGLYAAENLPVLDMIEPYYNNGKHENTIEIARRYLRDADRQYDGIMVVYGGDSDYARVYSRQELMVR